jgi:hypothetical protein
MILSKRMLICIICGAVLGVVCIVGATLRSDSALEFNYLLSFWYNRLLIGFVIGLAGRGKSLWIMLMRGALIGLLVSFAFYSSTGFQDPIGFAAGIVYGVIIESVAGRLQRAKE